MNKTKILSFFGIVAIIALLIGATNKLTIDQQRLNATISGVSLIGSVPIGGMVAVTPNTHANAWQPPADCSTIKDGFMRTSTAAGVACNVPACSDCIIPTGTTLPNMYQKYARGGGTSGSTGGANTQASNVAVATQPAINNHSFTQPSAHAITQPAINNHTFTQPSAHSITIPGHYHSMSTGSTLSASTTNSTHAHTSASNWSYLAVNKPGSGAAAQGSYYAQDTVVNTGPDGSHSHIITGSLGLVTGGSNGDAGFSPSSISNNHSGGGVDGHSLSQNVALTNNHSGGGVDGHSLSQNVTLTNNTVNNEPSYLEVVWVIRVK